MSKTKEMFMDIEEMIGDAMEHNTTEEGVIAEVLARARDEKFYFVSEHNVRAVFKNIMGRMYDSVLERLEDADATNATFH